ncbi:MAG TPA: MFS transporter [Opitutus sp.]|nr:MFS transporter [Opitutus sp.]
MPKDGSATRPRLFFFLVLPSGINSGFASITLPFVLTRAGFSVTLTASIVALSVSANLWRFLWGPVADLTLSARRWYLLGLVGCAAMTLAVGFVPLHPDKPALLMTAVFLSAVAATFVVLPVGGLMAHTVAEQAKGRACGWYQAGNLGGTGLGGGAGVWLATHFSKEVAAGGLALVMLGSAFTLYFVPDVRLVATERIAERLRLLGRDLLSMVRSAIPLFTIALVCSPIGAGGLSNVWSAIAPDWHVSDDRVALVNGLLNGIISAIGCVIGGWVADRWGRWWSYFGSGVLLGLCAIGMAFGPRTPAAFTAGVLAYALCCGMAYAAFSAIVVLAIGRGAAATKYATLASFGNLPVVYMTAFDGWAHDRFSTTWMLHADALTGIVTVVLALPALALINSAARTKRAALAIPAG